MKSKSKRLSKRFLSLFLSVLMMVSVMPFSGIIEAQAASKIATLYWPVWNGSGSAKKSISTHWNEFMFIDKNKNGKYDKGEKYWYHKGIDISGCNTSSRWYAAYDGVIDIVYSGCKNNANGDHSKCNPKKNGVSNKGKEVYNGTCNNGYGNGFRLKCTINKKTYYIEYAHMNAVNSSLKKGDSIKAGTFLGYVGDRGNSYGVHAHFDVQNSDKATINNDPTYSDRKFDYNYNLGYKVDIKDATNITANSATINAKANKTITPEKCHYYVSTNYNYLKNLDTTINTYKGNTKPGMPNSHTSNTNMDCFQLFPDDVDNPKIRDNFSIKVDKYKGKTLEQNKTYYYKMSVRYDGKWYQTGVGSFTTKSTTPGDATVKLSSLKDIGLSDTAVLTWNAASNTKYYSVKVYNSNNIQVGNTIDNITTLGYTVPETYFTTAGDYTFKVTAKNDYASKELTGIPTVTVHNNVKVSFVNDDDTLIEEQTIKYNGSATLPASPSREGYSFNKWEGEYKNVKTDSTVKAVYNKNSYTVKFFDGLNGKLLKTEKVYYKEAAHAPDVSDAGPYIFKGWNKDYTSITEDTTVTANYSWYNNNYPASTVIQSTSRNNNKTGYDVTVAVTAGDANDKVEGRVIIALMTQSGYLLNTTESAAFSLRAGDTKTLSVFAPCNQLAYSIKVFTINEYQKTGPIAEPIEDTINNNTANGWVGWKEYTNESEVPVVGQQINGQNVVDVDTRKDSDQYRYRTTTVTKSYSTSLAGYTQNGYENIKASEGTNHYVKVWPTTTGKTVIDPNHSWYKQYSAAPVKAVNNDTTYITVGSESVETYLFWQWAVPNYTANDLCNAIGDYKGENISGKGSATKFNMIKRSTQKPNWSSTYLGYNQYDKSASTYSKWWSGYHVHKNDGGIPVYKSSWVKYNKYYTYYKINDWTAWANYSGNVPVTKVSSDVAFKTNDSVYDVQTKVGTKYYNYKTESEVTASDVDVAPEQIKTISAKVDESFAGRTATVYVYKYAQPSDYTNEYIGNTTVQSDGTIMINNVKLREAPSGETGDLTVVASIEGNTAMVEIGKFEAPKPTYTVSFYDFDKTTLLKQETVEAGETVYAPDINNLHPSEGCRFSHWNQSTANVQSDLIVYPEEEKETYKVIFVDWNNRNVSVEEMQYGEIISTPEIEESTEGVISTWNMSDATAVTEDGITVYTVTKDTIITTETEQLQLVTSFISPESVKAVEDPTNEDEVEAAIDIETIDESDIVFSTSVEFSNRISTPIEIEENPDYIFYGWRDIKTGEYLEDTTVTNDATYYPVYEFAETTEAPVADVETGEYNESKTVTLTSETPDAVIYYTTDGSDPKTSETAIEYSAPINITRPTVINAYATSLGRNNSYTVNHLYAVNTSSSGVAYHLVTVYSTLDLYGSASAAYQGMVRDSRYFDDSEFDKDIEGYNYVGLFSDAECTQQFFADEELISQETTLFAKYSPKTLSVTFKDWNGTALSTVQHTYGEAEIDAPTPTRDGYVFLGWDVDDFSSIYEDTIATARYCREEDYATVTLNKTAARIIEGQQFTKLAATVSPEELSDTEVAWSSSDESIAAVDDNGIVTATGNGTATITVTVVATGECASCVFTVLADYNKSIVFGSNSFLGFDSEGYIRMARPDKNTLSELLYQFENEAENLSFTSVVGNALANDDLVGTGTVVKFTDDGEELDSATFVMTGDLNGDGYIGNADVSMLCQWIVNKKELTYVQQLAADVNGDGSINNKDASVIQRYLVGKAEI